MDGGAIPFTIKGLRLSKVPSTPCTKRPPLGADGSAYGKLAKPSGQAGAPCIAMPCRRATRPAWMDGTDEKVHGGQCDLRQFFQRTAPSREAWSAFQQLAA